MGRAPRGRMVKENEKNKILVDCSCGGADHFWVYLLFRRYGAAGKEGRD